MKKLSYLLGFSFIVCTLMGISAFSAPKQTANVCPAKPYPVSNVMTRGLQGITGMNWLTARIAESQIKGQLKKQMQHGNIKIHIKPYSAMDLTAGKLKSFEFTGKNMESNGLFISYFEAKSLCDFIHLNLKKDPVEPLAPLYLTFKSTITEKDLNNIINSREYQENLTRVKLNFYNVDFSLIDFMNPNVDIKGSKIFISANMHLTGTPKFLAIPIKIGTGLRVQNNKIRLTDLQMFSSNPATNMGPISDFIEKISMAVLDISDYGQDGTEITIKDIEVNNDKINVEGTVWMPAKQ